jgi:guanyl_kin: guanylate kinase
MVWNISSYLLRNSDNALPIMSFWNTKKYTKTVSTEPWKHKWKNNWKPDKMWFLT